jgi:hypothetical protein
MKNEMPKAHLMSVVTIYLAVLAIVILVIRVVSYRLSERHIFSELSVLLVELELRLIKALQDAFIHLVPI